METLLNDLFHAQPDVLLMMAGLIFLTIAIVGSVKTYFDPGKGGRIAAGAIGGALLVTGLILYKPQTPPSAPVDEAVAKSKAAPTAKPAAKPHNAAAGAAVAEAPASHAAQTTTACYFPGKWPVDLRQPMPIGDSCTMPSGATGRAILANSACTYTSGPLSGTTAQFHHLMYVGVDCQSPDHTSKGTVLAAPAL